MKVFRQENKTLWIERLLLLLIGVGVFFGTYNFVHNRSLWLDESMLSLGIVTNSFSSLYKPLIYGQIAPIGWLYLQKCLTSIFGNYDWVLRIIPFVSYLLCIRLIYVFNQKLFDSKLTGLLSSAFFSMNMTVILYATEVKQYSSDIFFTLLIALCALEYKNSTSKKALITYSLVGAIALWFSNVAIIVLLCFSLYHVFSSLNRKNSFKYKFFIPLTLWFLSFAIYFILFIHSHPGKANMVNYWQSHFLPDDVFSKEFYTFLMNKGIMVFRDLLNYYTYWAYTAIITCFGLLHLLLTKKFNTVFILLAPIFIHLFLSYFELYPFDKRLILYLIPFVLSLFSFQIIAFFNLVFSRNVYLGFVALCLLLYLPLKSNFLKIRNQLPIERQEVKSAVKIISKNLVPGDGVFVYYATQPTFLFYKNLLSSESIKEDLIYMGNKGHRDDWSLYDQELQNLPDGVWFVFSHVYQNKTTMETEENYMINTLIKNGYYLAYKDNFPGASIYRMSKNPEDEMPMDPATSEALSIQLKNLRQISSVEDAVIMEHEPNRILGKSPEIILVRNEKFKINNVALFKYDLSTLDTSSVDNVFMSLFFNANSAYGKEHSGKLNLVVKMVTNDWNEASISWSNKPEFISSDSIIVGRNHLNSLGNLDSIDITNFYLNAKTTREQYLSLWVRLQPENSYAKFLFCAKENSNTSLRPTLFLNK